MVTLFMRRNDTSTFVSSTCTLINAYIPAKGVRVVNAEWLNDSQIYKL